MKALYGPTKKVIFGSCDDPEAGNLTQGTDLLCGLCDVQQVDIVKVVYYAHELRYPLAKFFRP